ncbi:CBO0543 family protein [Bacillus sp. 2205SS5-2]|uniref:CBO0543 family protein n=1 Tax=Bacillus sp. 2205SS5-2 TaxID=3109031 RepID=UPI003005F2D9
MHLAIAIIVVLSCYRWGNWNNWREYHASMFFITTGGLLYEFMVKDFSLWKFHPDFLYGHDITVIVYALITMPLTVYLFLSHFPTKKVHQFLYIFGWSFLYIVFEWILHLFGRISYKNGWNFWDSFLFDLTMFSIIALHQKHPLRAYILSIGIILFLLSYFHVPFPQE